MPIMILERKKGKQPMVLSAFCSTPKTWRFESAGRGWIELLDLGIFGGLVTCDVVLMTKSWIFLFFLCKICAKKKSPEKPTYHFRQAHIFTNLEDPGIRLMGTLGWWEWFRSIKMIWHRSGGHKFCGSDRPKMTMWVNFIENQGCHWELV